MSELYLDSTRATMGGRDMTAAGQELTSLHQGPVAAINAASLAQPWGRDNIGAKFQEGYGPQLEQFVQAFGTIATYVEGLGEAVVASVQDNMDADARAGQTVDQAYRL
ncbi:hypothetical protein [Actinoplanes utahensis]|nr:hypothetical protein [Actinoplanes utahensis]GIF35156.1 hypothetical protein Aut01nite_81420 [Actinoplanes utahensis]